MQKPFQSVLARFEKIAGPASPKGFTAWRVSARKNPAQKTRRWLVFTLLLFLLNACTPLASSQPFYFVTPESAPSLTPFQPAEITPEPTWPVLFTPTALPSLTPSRTPTATATLMPSPLPPTVTTAPSPTPETSILALDAITYNINILWDYSGRTVTAAQEITYPNRSGETLDTILLAVNPNLWRGTFSLETLTVDGQPAPYTLSGQTLTLPLPEPLATGQSLLIGLKYTLNLPYSSGTFQNFGYTARQTNLIDWFPFVPPYFPGQGWILPEPWNYGENFAYPLADFYVGLTFADIQAPTIAASAPAESQGNTLRYKFRGRTFTLAASYDFLTISGTEDGITVTSYYFPEHANAGQRILLETQAALRTYAEAFGPYPHTSLAIVETDLNDGLESDGLYFLASSFYAKYDGTAANDLVMIGIHEAAHQWWFGGISNNQALEPWLDESLSTYSERIFYEQNYPNLLNWWYNVRINYYGPSGYADTRLYNTGSFRTYVNAVYLRGALFLDALRNRIGDEAFFAFLQDYYARHQGRIATADTFFTVLADHTTAADDLIQTYFYYR